MNRRCNIAFVVISAFILLLAPFMPHHHHEGVSCVAVEHCEYDNVYNDKHTGHNDSSQGSIPNASCVENAHYLTSNTGQNSKTSTEDSNSEPLELLFVLKYELLLGYNFHIKIKIDYGEHLVTYDYTDFVESNGMRGSPSVLA